jgi:hypothetical protein
MVFCGAFSDPAPTFADDTHGMVNNDKKAPGWTEAVALLILLFGFLLNLLAT